MLLLIRYIMLTSASMLLLIYMPLFIQLSFLSFLEPLASRRPIEAHPRKPLSALPILAFNPLWQEGSTQSSTRSRFLSWYICVFHSLPQ